MQCECGYQIELPKFCPECGKQFNYEVTPTADPGISIAELPEVLTAKHISEHLHLSKRRVYELIQINPTAGGIKSFDIGRSRRVMKKDYLDWLTSKQNQ